MSCPKLTRSQVYDILNGERNYQNYVVHTNNYAKVQPVSGELLLMEQYLQEARQQWVNNKGDEACLNFMRKVAGVAVRCFENHGCPPRE